MTGTRPLTRNQQLQHRAFLKALARTGNAKLAAAAIGISDATLHGRRKRYPPFAQSWEATLAAAKARLHRRGGAQGAAGPAGRAAGGEPVITLLANGRLQVRAARRGSLTKATEQAFLASLSVTANISLSAAAAGASVAAFTRRRRRDPGFAREMRLALAAGCQRLEEALIAGFLPDSHTDDAWRHNDPPEMPAMTPTQALQLLYLQQKKVMLRAEAAMPARRRGDPPGAANARRHDAYAVRVKQQAEDNVIAGLNRMAAQLGLSPHEEPPQLPDLDQVTGWSGADPAKQPHGESALFGGWRDKHLDPAQRNAALEKGRATPAGTGKRAAERRAEGERLAAEDAARYAAEVAKADARDQAALARRYGGEGEGD